MKKTIKRSILICIVILLFLVLIVFFVRQYHTTNNNIVKGNNDKTNEKTVNLTNSDLSYSSNREDYESDEQFANFRLVEVGNIKPIIYRGASPVNNTYNRAQITNELLKKYNIRYIINLADTEKKFKDYANIFDYTNSLYKENKIYFGNLSIEYETQEFAKNIAKSLMQITNNEGPFYIHCNHGRDRTGMACIILEALADASYTEILNDYMKTYENYNFINEKTNPQKYKTIFDSRFKNAIYYITKDKNIDDYNSYDYKAAVKEYLKFGGLTESEINKIEVSIIGEKF